MRRPRIDHGQSKEAGGAAGVAEPIPTDPSSAEVPAVPDLNGSIPSSLTDECRRLGELLHLDTVGIVSTGSGSRQVTWWAAPGAPGLPPRLDDILEGRASGWIVQTGLDGAVFARTTPRTPARSASVLEALGPSLVTDAALDHARRDLHAAAASDWDMPRASDGVEPDAGDAIDPHEVGIASRAALAIRQVLFSEEATVFDLLEAVRRAIDADEMFLLTDLGDDVEVLATSDGDWPRRIPPEVRAGWSGTSSPEGIDDARARQLGVVLGAKSALLRAAPCGDPGTMETILVGWSGGSPPPGPTLGVVARVVGLGRAAVLSREREVQALMQKERTRWAYAIHDGLTQVVTTVVLELDRLRRGFKEDPDRAVRTLEATKMEIRRALGELRNMLFELSDEENASLGSAEPFEKYVDDVVRRWRLPAKVSLAGDFGAMPKSVRDAAYVVIRESLANAAKHAASKSVAVRVQSRAGEVEVEVEDAGRGFVQSGSGRRTKHFGLDMMRRRVEEEGGTLAIESSPGNGTRVVARLPVRHQGERP